MRHDGKTEVGPAVLAAAACLVSGCLIIMSDDDDGIECTMMGCEDMLTVTVEQSDSGFFPDAYYRFAFEGPSGDDDAVVGCSVENGAIKCEGDTDNISVGLTGSGRRFVVTLFAAPLAITLSV